MVVALTFVSCSASKKIAEDSEGLKREAKDFSLTIIESYFSKDCEKVFNSMSDSLLIMDGDGIISKFEVEERLCDAVKRAIREEGKTIRDYTESYNIEMLTANELAEKYNYSLPEYYLTVESDFFFIGQRLKVGEEVDFIWDDLFVFMVRKQNQNWILKGISG